MADMGFTNSVIGDVATDSEARGGYRIETFGGSPAETVPGLYPLS